MVSNIIEDTWDQPNYFVQPKEIKDLKEFIKIVRREQKSLPSAEKITIKKNKRNGITKFKLRTSKYLFTLKVDDKVKADKIMQSIPPNLKKETKNWASPTHYKVHFVCQSSHIWKQSSIIVKFKHRSIMSIFYITIEKILLSANYLILFQ